jgi:hypothetical protein
MATAAQIAVIRAWAGTAADLTDLDTRLEELGSPEAVALQMLRQQLSDLLQDPAKLDVDGDVAADWSANIVALRGQISQLQTVVNDLTDTGPGVVTTSTLGRAGYRR